MDQQSVNAALDTLRPSLTPDGFDLRVGELGPDGSVQVILEAKPDACVECMVPEEIIVQIVEDAIRRQDSSVTRVELVKYGFDQAH